MATRTITQQAPVKPERSIVIPVPKAAVGWIVGKGGAKVKEIKASSGS